MMLDRLVRKTPYVQVVSNTSQIVKLDTMITMVFVLAARPVNIV
jgi:hypothetical protein